MRRPSLAILMTHPTQFDGPLFSKIARTGPFELSVYYLDTDCIAWKVDGELGFSPNWDIPVTEGYRCVVCPQPFLSKVRFIYHECLASGKYDLVIFPGYTRLALTLLALLPHRQAIGVRLDTAPIYPEPVWKQVCKRVVLRRLFRRFATFHPAGSLTERFLRELGLDSTQVFRFPYAVDNAFLAERADFFRRQRKRWRGELEISGSAFTVLGVLKFVPRENPLELLEGFRLFHQTFPDSALVLVGAGPLRPEIESFLGRNGLERAVRLVGYAKYSELPRWYAVSDVFVHPAVWECWGVSVNEAMACGLPVVASDRVGSVYDLVIDRVNGYRYPSGNCHALADCLTEIGSRVDRGRAMGEASRRSIAAWGHEATIISLTAALEKARWPYFSQNT